MSRYDEPEAERCRQQVVQLAKAMLRGEVGVLQGCRMMLAYRFCTGLDEFDEDLLTFVGVESQEDHLPIGPERQFWNPAALERVDGEIKEAERVHRPAVMLACESLIRRLEAPPAATN